MGRGHNPGWAWAVGGYVAALNGLMFAIGTDLSSALYAAPLAALISAACVSPLGRIPWRKVLAFSAVLALVVWGSYLTAVSGTALHYERLEAAGVSYGRGLLIAAVVLFALGRRADVWWYMRGYTYAAFFLVAAGSVLGVSYLGDAGLYHAYGSFIGEQRPLGFSGLFHNPNYWSIFLLSTIPGLMWLYREEWVGNAFFWVAASTIAFNILLTGSRMGIIGVILMVGASVFLWKHLDASDPGRSLLARPFRSVGHLAGLTAGLAVIAALVWRVLWPRVPALQAMTARTTRVVDAPEREVRTEMVRDAVSTWAGQEPWHLVAGLGFRAAEGPHNSFVSVLVELGVLGLLAFGFLICGIAALGLLGRTLAGGERLFLLLVALSLAWMSATNDLVETRSFWTLLGVVLALGVNKGNAPSKGEHSIDLERRRQPPSGTPALGRAE